jgi:hypothetical protein
VNPYALETVPLKKLFLGPDPPIKDDNVEPPISIDEDNYVEVDYKFHIDATFVQFNYESKNVEEVKGLSQITPTLHEEEQYWW